MSIRRRSFLTGLAAAAAAMKTRAAWSQTMSDAPDLILRNARITTLDPAQPEAQAIAVQDGLVRATGTDEEIMRLAGSETETVDLKDRCVIPHDRFTPLHQM